MRHLFLFNALLFSFFGFSQSIITGTILDGEFSDPLPFANILLTDAVNDVSLGGSTSDFDGKYSFEVVPGEYVLEFSFVGYGVKKITGIVVDGDGEVIVDVTLSPADNSLDEVIVTTTVRQNSEQAVLALQKKSINLMDGLSAQTIKKTGDTNLAAAIKRVPGVSIQDGKFVYVRGLGDRYSKTLLGGLEIPGLDPDKNTLQLDIFPTNLLENIIINKSASAALNADFSGGIVNIVLKDFSTLPEYTFSVSGSYNPSMNLVNNAVRNNPDGLNFFGFNNGYYDRPISAQQDIPSPEVSLPGMAAKLIRVTELFEQQMGVVRYNTDLNYSLGGSASNQYVLDNGKTIGFIAALGFRSNTEYYKNRITGTTNKEGQGTGFTAETTQEGEEGRITKLASGLLGVSLKTEQSKYKLNFLNLRSVESNAVNAIYRDFLENPYVGVANILTHTERNIISIPFNAKHILNEGNSIIEWKIAPSYAEVLDKDFKKTVFETDEEFSFFALSPATTQLPQRLWRTLKEKALASNIILTQELNGEKFVEGKLKIGGSFSTKNRDFDTSNYSIDYLGRSENLNGDPNSLLAPNNIWNIEQNEGSFIVGSFQRTNQYEASSSTAAGFVSAELKFSDQWKSVIGLRFENYIVKYTGEDFEQVYNKTELINVADLFPSLNVIHSLDEDTNIRFSYARTTARPSFKENSAARIFDPITERFFIGNPELNPSYINNIDLRYEKYGEGNQFLSFSTFFKYLADPIEVVAFDYNTANELIARNSRKATIFGVELEYRKNLINNDAKKLAFNVNASYIQSKLRMTDQEFFGRVTTEPTRNIEPDRRLQGQSPFLINTGVNYLFVEEKIDASLFYNVQGKTLEVVGVGNIPDVYTDPFHNLNLTVIKKFGENDNQTVTLKVQNILDDSRESFYDYFGEQQLPFSFYKQDRTFSLSYNIKF